MSKSKITSEIADKIKKYAEMGWNATSIGKDVKLSKDTVSSWCIKNNIPLVKRVRKGNVQKTEIFIKALKKTGSPKEASKTAGLPSNGSHIIEKYNLQKYVRSRQDSAKLRRVSIKEAQKRVPKGNGIIVGFNEQDKKYVIETMDGFVYRKNLGKLSQGDPRGKCGKIASINEIRKILKKHKYTLLEDSYSKKNKALEAVHDICGNVRKNRLSNFFVQECPTCSNTGTSKVETEIKEWVQSFGLETKKFRFKGKTKGQEIDIYVPSLKIGIEYCGLYWHNEEKKENNYHHNKMLKANEEGIRLITIFEDEWLERESQVKNFLESILNIRQKRIYARKCTIKEVEKNITKEFLDKHHIQGKTSSTVAFGLYFEDELVGLITGRKHYIKDNNSFILNRLVFEDGIQVIGGASKLLKPLWGATQQRCKCGYKHS